MTYRIILTKNPFPIHISHNPDFPLRNAGIRENAKALSAALSAALMKMWMLLDQPEQILWWGSDWCGGSGVELGSWDTHVRVLVKWQKVRIFLS